VGFERQKLVISIQSAQFAYSFLHRQVNLAPQKGEFDGFDLCWRTGGEIGNDAVFDLSVFSVALAQKMANVLA